MNKMIMLTMVLFLVSACTSKNNSQTKLPNTTLKVLFYKDVGDALPIVSFNGKKAAVILNNGVVLDFNIQSKETKEYNFSRWCKSEDRFIAGYVDEKILITCDNQLLEIDSSNESSPKEIFKFPKRIRWVEENNGRLLALSEADEYAYFENGKVVSKGHHNQAGARSSLGYHEMYENSPTTSSVLNFNDNGKCGGQFSQDFVRFGKIPETNLGYGYKLKRGRDDDIAFVGIDCKKSSIIWEKSFRNDVFRLHVPNNNAVGELSTARACGNNACINISTNDTSFGGTAKTGVWCFNPSNGKETFSSFNEFKLDPPINGNLNMLAPMICDDNKIVVFKNSSPFVLTQELSNPSGSFKSYIDSDAISQIAKVARPSSDAFLIPTNFLPKTAQDRIAILVAKKHLFVLGE